MKKKLAILLLALLLLLSCSAAAMAATIGNNGYPNAMCSGSSPYTLTLSVEAEGAAAYQWQVADAEEGPYTNIAAADAAEYTFAPVNGKWYRCEVDGTFSKAVQAVKCSGDEFFEPDNSGKWYVGNGNMAYVQWKADDDEHYFDIVGKYTHGEETMYLNTTYDGLWTVGSSDKPYPEKTKLFYSPSSAVEKLLFSFDENDRSSVSIAAVLAANQKAFAIGTDTMLGDYYEYGFAYADTASLKAILKDGKLSQVQMVGAASVDTALETDPAFVFKPLTETACFWIGSYYQEYYGLGYVCNEGHAGFNDSYTFTELGDKNIVTEVREKDSSMAVSWLDLKDNTVSFSFHIGTVEETGAETPSTPDPEDSTPSGSGKRYDITVKETANGDVEVKSSAGYDSGVIITPAPHYGYEVADITVTAANGKDVPVTHRADGTYSFSMPRAAVTVEVTFAPLGELVEIILTIGSNIILVNGDPITYDVAPVITAGRTFLPIRIIAENLGAEVLWDEPAQRVVISKDNTVIELFIGKTTVLINGRPQELEAPVYIENSRTFLPVRLIAERLGADVEWNNDAQTVTITGRK